MKSAQALLCCAINTFGVPVRTTAYGGALCLGADGEIELY